MQTFDQSLYDLYSQGLVSYETALENASNPDDFKLKVQGVHSPQTPHASKWSKLDLAPEEHSCSTCKQPPKRNTQGDANEASP
jgi:hypothetical protein